jgi:hypothetical protein
VVGLVLAVALALTLVLALTDVLALGGVLVVAVVLTEVLAVGESTVTEEDGLEPGLEVQAESATLASTVMRPKPTAVSLTRCAVRTMAVRAFIEPPRALGNDHFPAADRRNRHRKRNPRGRPLATDRAGPRTAPAKTPGTITVSPGWGANRQWRAHHRNIRLLG